MKIVHHAKHCYLYYGRVRSFQGGDMRGRTKHPGRKTLLGILILRPEGWQIEIEGIHDVNGGYLFAARGEAEHTYYADLRTAKRIARESFRKMENARLAKGWRLASFERFRSRVNAKSSDWKVRRCRQTPEIAHTIRKMRYPMFVGDDFHNTTEEMIDWLDERRCGHPMLEGHAYATKRFLRAMTYRVHDVVIDFPDAATAFEFKMRWL